MTTKLKKLLTSLLAFSLVLGMLPMGTMASAAANITNEGNEDITVLEYHVPYDFQSDLENLARQTNPDISGKRWKVTQIHVVFEPNYFIYLHPNPFTRAWSGTVVDADSHQPQHVTSIQFGFWRAFHDTVFVTIGADKLNFANYQDRMNFTEISLASETPTP
ncbi:MAG: hypothetical protein RR828_05850, partial [Oscillospiraceae bacterium]